MRRSTTSLVVPLILPLAVAGAQPTIEPAFDGYTFRPIGTDTFPRMFVDMAELPTGSLLLADKSGRIYALDEESGATEALVLDIMDEVNSLGDSGLMSILLDPDFPAEPWIYTFESVDPNPANPDRTVDRYARICRYPLDPAAGYLRAIEEGRQILLGESWGTGILQEAEFHASGEMNWGSDGTLLITLGDSHIDLLYAPKENDSYGPGRFDPSLNIGTLRAQTLNNHNGKLLRMDRRTGDGLPSNPFWNGDPRAPQSRIWAYGLREPWRFVVLPEGGSSDPADGRPGTILVGDVGKDSYEEVNRVSPAGGDNFGWPFWEAHLPVYPQETYDGPVPLVVYTATKPPDVAFTHNANNASQPAGVFEDATPWMNCITAGPRIPDDPAGPYDARLRGRIPLFDYLGVGHFIATTNEAGVFTAVDRFGSGNFGAYDIYRTEGPVDFHLHRGNKHLYVLALWRIHRLEYDPTGGPPVARLAADRTSGALPLTVTLDASATSGGAPPLRYEWHVDGIHAGESDDPLREQVFAEDRNIPVEVRVVDAMDRASTATLTIRAGNLPPVVSIVDPTVYTKYPSDGTRIPVHLLGGAVDPDGAEPPALEWNVYIATKAGRNLHRLDTFQGAEATVIMGMFDQPAFHLVEFSATDDRGERIQATVRVWPEGHGPIEGLDATGWWLR